jgi:UDP-MurNAc hydroxylase
MKLTMLSHASVLIEEGSVAVCSDPWFIGEAFNNSWSLLCKPAVGPTDLHGVSHIWISHEHPDHLNYPTLKAIPNEQKTRITLLYQKHFSSRMAYALGKLGFREVIELPLGHWVPLSGDVSVMCWSIGSIDSLLATRSTSATVLNLNDCIMDSGAARDVARRIGHVDVLLQQFSIATRVGNPGESIIRPRQVIMERLRQCIIAFRPKLTIPFASFVYFSHTENRYMNQWVITPDQVSEELLDAPTQLQFLYNGDSWSSQEGVCVQGDPLERYRRDFNEIPDRPYRSDSSYSLDELLALGRKLVQKVRPAFPKLLLSRVPAIHFYVTDVRRAICFDLRNGHVDTVAKTKPECDMALGSQALWFSFKFPWGFSTLDVSGRYELINPKVNKLGLYLCHMYCSDMHFQGLLRRLSERRVWSFWWTKRNEVLERILRWKAPMQTPTPVAIEQRRVG